MDEDCKDYNQIYITIGIVIEEDYKHTQFREKNQMGVPIIMSHQRYNSTYNLNTSYSEETQTQIEEFLENTFGWDEDELVDFIERYGEEKFKLYFEEYADMVDDIGIGVVLSFLDVFDIENVSSCRDAYQGLL